MILKTAANYNDEGGYIEAWKNSDGTTEVKLIPKSGGGKQGLKSITISPAITTTPALDSLFPIYYDDLTEEQKESGILLSLYTEAGIIHSGDQYTATITPTEDWYATDENNQIFGNKGEPLIVTLTAETDDALQFGMLGAMETNEPSGELPHFVLVMGSIQAQ